MEIPRNHRIIFVKRGVRDFGRKTARNDLSAEDISARSVFPRFSGGRRVKTCSLSGGINGGREKERKKSAR